MNIPTSNNENRNVLTWALASFTKRGFTGTFSAVYHYLDNWLFDWRYQTDTASPVLLNQLDIPENLHVDSNRYDATKSVVLKSLLKSIELERELVFIDVGCGKGKALMLAAQAGCRTVIGIEISELLCDIARDNLMRFSKYCDFESRVVSCDAGKYEFNDTENIIYFYNPFTAKILEFVLQALHRSLSRAPRNIKVIYFVPDHRSAFDSCDFLTLESEHKTAGCEALIYANKST